MWTVRKILGIVVRDAIQSVGTVKTTIYALAGGVIASVKVAQICQTANSLAFEFRERLTWGSCQVY